MSRLSRYLAVLALSAFSASRAPAAPPGPFTVSASAELREGGPVVRVSFDIPPAHFLYADHIEVKASDDLSLVPLDVPEPETVLDKFSEENKKVYRKPFDAVYRVEGAAAAFTLTVAFQGCDETVCFFPEKKTFALSLDGTRASEVSAPAPAAAGAEWRELAAGFQVAARDTGYLAKDKFLSFLASGVSGAPAADPSLSRFARLGALATALLILLGGMGLNLTPCVLPLIPINLAIIGAGAKAGSRGRGFALGAAYGLGMAFVYGLLGLIVVLTGAKFGTLNSSPWFNVTIAVVFVVLSLAMFDVITIDFTRFQGRAGMGRKGHFTAALVMGAVSALLAGACVAPVVFSVLLLAGNLYSKGQALGLALPFLLGAGMGLPWPFAGAGLSFLPKPGRWMTGVKYAFGVLILIMAGYYAHLSYQLFRVGGHSASGGAATAESSNTALVEALRRAGEEGKPVFIDFWATWCKNCLAMEKTTFKDPEVQARLKDFMVVKYQAELPNESPAKDVLDYFGAIGLPTYVVLTPKPPLH